MMETIFMGHAVQQIFQPDEIIVWVLNQAKEVVSQGAELEIMRFAASSSV
jgi:hypothetical protein